MSHRVSPPQAQRGMEEVEGVDEVEEEEEDVE